MCMGSVTRYRDSHRKSNADCSFRITRRKLQSREAETKVDWVDGTCMLISNETLRAVGFLDPHFRAPGWGADVDYSHRVQTSGRELYVSHRAMLWHHQGRGGLSATQIYGDRFKWAANGLKQAKEDLRSKYGPDWRDVLPTPREAYGGKSS